MMDPAYRAFADHPGVPLGIALAVFLVNGLWLGRRSARVAGWFAVTGMAVAAAWCVGLAKAYMTAHLGADNPAQTEFFTWAIFTGDFTAAIGMYLDPASVMMLCVIFLIALPVHLYSVWYMEHDAARGRFFALLPFFVFSMAGLVVSSNLVQLYIFWELVGVSSYQLISFWYEKPSAVAAGKKAFIVTRFADSFFLLGIVITAASLGGLDFAMLNLPLAGAAMDYTLTIGPWSFNGLAVGTICIFMGGWGKSALFPLHIWLPDAMEGPTPVSSIIHSATMVVAGVFLTARLFPLFAAAGVTLQVAMVAGVLTAALAAIVACTQKDIKRILAFSTLSQIGYMMLALGAAYTVDGEVNPAGYAASLFHIFTHAFFKCLLFLGAGVVIHTVHSNLLDDMGGLRKHLPVTYACLFIAILAISGIYPFAGYFSKEEILRTCLEGGHTVVFGVALLTAGLTAFYMSRFFLLIFHGTPRGHTEHAHEDIRAMIPMIFLAIGSVVAGFLARDLFGHHFMPPGFHAGEHAGHIAWLPWASTAMALLGILSAVAMYMRPTADLPAALNLEKKSGMYRFVYHQGRTNEGWLFLARRVGIEGICRLLKWFDRTLVDGSVNAGGQSMQVGGFLVRLLQNGQLAFYVAVYVVGLLIIWFASGGTTP